MAGGRSDGVDDSDVGVQWWFWGEGGGNGGGLVYGLAADGDGRKDGSAGMLEVQQVQLLLVAVRELAAPERTL